MSFGKTGLEVALKEEAECMGADESSGMIGWGRCGGGVMALGRRGDVWGIGYGMFVNGEVG